MNVLPLWIVIVDASLSVFDSKELLLKHMEQLIQEKAGSLLTYHAAETIISQMGVATDTTCTVFTIAGCTAVIYRAQLSEGKVVDTLIECRRFTDGINDNLTNKIDDLFIMHQFNR